MGCNKGYKYRWKASVIIWGPMHTHFCRDVIEVHVFLDRRDKKEVNALGAITENKCHWAAQVCSLVALMNDIAFIFRTWMRWGPHWALAMQKMLWPWSTHVNDGDTQVSRVHCPGSFWALAPLIFLLHISWHVPVFLQEGWGKFGRVILARITLTLF